MINDIKESRIDKAEKNISEVLKRIGARDYVSPNIEIDFHRSCICEDFIQVI